MHHSDLIPSPLGRPPLELSEILDVIFSFLGQQALQTISLVCRQWHLIALRHIKPWFHWNGLESSEGDPGYLQELETTRKKLMEARILNCGRPHTPYLRIPQERNPEATARWKASHGLVEEVAQEDQLWVQQLTLRLNRDSWYSGICLFPRLDGPHFGGEGGGMRCIGTRLRDLVIETNVSHDSFPLQRILENCPKLFHLTLRATLDAIPTRLESYRPLPSREESWVLKSLTLENLTVGSTVLQEYFLRLSNLKELRLIVLGGEPAEGSKTLISSRVTQRSFFEHLAQHCQLLESLIYSTLARGEQPWLDEMEAVEAMEVNGHSDEVYLMLLKMFPHIRSWGLPFEELVIGAMRSESRVLNQLSLLVTENRVTTLEIVPGTWPFETRGVIDLSDIYRREWGGIYILHLFLRESPQLLHLKTKGVPFICPTESRLWACRGLKTLSILYNDQYSVYKTPYAIYRLKGQESRECFGYLSRMCPALEDLDLEITGEVLALRRGLCLLTRMQWLKRLTIHMNIDNWDAWDPRVNTLGEDDFSWMLRFPKSSSLPYASSSFLLSPTSSSPSSSPPTPPPQSILSASLPARQLPLEEEYANYQRKGLNACLLKIQYDDFYDCNDRKSQNAAAKARLPSPPLLGYVPTRWERIKSGALNILLQSVIQPVEMIDDWKDGRKRRAASIRALRSSKQSHYLTDYDREANEWPIVDGLKEKSIGNLLEVEARLLALIEAQTQLQARTPEQQRIVLAGEGTEKKEGKGKGKGKGKRGEGGMDENPPIWKKSGAIGDIVVADPWSFMEELRIEYRPTGNWAREKILRDHVPSVQKLLRKMRPDIEIHATYHSFYHPL